VAAAASVVAAASVPAAVSAVLAVSAVAAVSEPAAVSTVVLLSAAGVVPPSSLSQPSSANVAATAATIHMVLRVVLLIVSPAYCVRRCGYGGALQQSLSGPAHAKWSYRIRSVRRDKSLTNLNHKA
jgi:hypothetical protein